MEDTNIWRAINGITYSKKRAYFQWKNNIRNIRKDYGAMDEEEFLEYIDATPETLQYMRRWESTPEYKRLVFLLKEDQFATDLLEVYDKVKEKALNSADGQSIKSMISLQKEIKKYRKSIDDYEELEDMADDLII